MSDRMDPGRAGVDDTPPVSPEPYVKKQYPNPLDVVSQRHLDAMRNDLAGAHTFAQVVEIRTRFLKRFELLEKLNGRGVAAEFVQQVDALSREQARVALATSRLFPAKPSESPSEGIHASGTLQTAVA